MSVIFETRDKWLMVIPYSMRYNDGSGRVDPF